MTSVEVLDIMREMCLLILKLSAPMVLSALILGIIISLIQAITQIQEMTLTFVPKLIVVTFVGLFVLPLLTPSFVQFTHSLFAKITASGIQ
jgi:flagellar biosynthetic protein FliQ